MNKEKLIEDFYKWLGDEFDKDNKETPEETHRWLFCWNGDEKAMFFDCACCIEDKHIDGCNCICHKRVEQIVDFFINYFEVKK